MHLRKPPGLSLLAGFSALMILAAPAAAWQNPAAPSPLLHLTHGCHQDVQRGTGGLHRHQTPGCERIAAPDPKLVRDKRGRWCQRVCRGAFPYEVCEFKNCRRSR